MRKKKKIRVRWGRLMILILAVAAIVALPIILVRSCISAFFGDDDTLTDETARMIPPEMMRRDSIMAHRIDSLFNIPQALDTARIAVSLYDTETGITFYSRHSSDTLPPASCMKIATALAALETLGMEHRFNESLQVRGEVVRDTLHGNLLLRADADPLMLDFSELMEQFKRSGIRHIDGNVYLDLALDERLVAHPSAKTWDIPYNKLPMLLKGKKFVKNNLLYALHISGISYRQNNAVRPSGKYRIVAHTSHPLTEAVSQMLIHSSNIKAETILYHMDWKAGMVKDHVQHWDFQHSLSDYLNRTFTSDSAALRSFVVNDGSGLSPYNRLSADFLVSLLRHAFDNGRIRDYFINEALATPGNGERRGSLLSRLSRPEYINRIFVKTGTITTIGASSLAGFIHGSDGHWYIFSIINTDSPVAEARIFQDRLCRELLR